MNGRPLTVDEDRLYWKMALRLGVERQLANDTFRVGLRRCYYWQGTFTACAISRGETFPDAIGIAKRTPLRYIRRNGERIQIGDEDNPDTGIFEKAPKKVSKMEVGTQ